jgi:hypothetical protein
MVESLYSNIMLDGVYSEVYLIYVSRVAQSV